MAIDRGYWQQLAGENYTAAQVLEARKRAERNYNESGEAGGDMPRGWSRLDEEQKNQVFLESLQDRYGEGEAPSEVERTLRKIAATGNLSQPAEERMVQVALQEAIAQDDPLIGAARDRGVEALGKIRGDVYTQAPLAGIDEKAIAASRANEAQSLGMADDLWTRIQRIASGEDSAARLQARQSQDELARAVASEIASRRQSPGSAREAAMAMAEGQAKIGGQAALAAQQERLGALQGMAGVAGMRADLAQRQTQTDFQLDAARMKVEQEKLARQSAADMINMQLYGLGTGGLSQVAQMYSQTPSYQYAAPQPQGSLGWLEQAFLNMGQKGAGALTDWAFSKAKKS